MSEKILKITSSQSIYINNDFYSNNMKESVNGQNYQVDIKAIRVNWIIESEDGFKFL